MNSNHFKYKIWADTRALEAIQRVDSDTQAQALSFLCRQVNHMVIVEELFRSRLEGLPAPHTSTNTSDIPQLDELTSRLLASGNWYLGFIENVENGDRPIHFTFADGKPGLMTVDEILFHVVNHGSYHRGNIARALDQAGVPHPIDGYGAFIHEAEPERRHNSE